MVEKGKKEKVVNLEKQKEGEEEAKKSGNKKENEKGEREEGREMITSIHWPFSAGKLILLKINLPSQRRN